MHDPQGYNIFFFFNDTATTEIYTLSLHDALPISIPSPLLPEMTFPAMRLLLAPWTSWRSEEHTSELQSQSNLVCRLLLEKKKNYQRRAALLSITLALTATDAIRDRYQRHYRLQVG